MDQDSATKFDSSRAGDYERQSRIALAGYDACHELSACMLSAALGQQRRAARVLVVGAGGTAGELVAAARLEPQWSFVALDPSAPMLDLARAHLNKSGLSDRVETVLGVIGDLDNAPSFDAAIMIGVLHHLPGDAAKQDLLAQIATRLKPGAPFVLAGNCRTYGSHPLLLAAWAARWRMSGGAGEEETQAKMGTILQGVEPPASEEVVFSLLTEAGFKEPIRFFESLFWGAWLARRVETTNQQPTGSKEG
ncbi:class I SAM-dependent methyltransferase [Pelagibacterium sp. H642]|uniref:class I SAM-dependent methyltransferase n=1 Tax=Pelagibacterium sp. H642 TaxID=1881069 RepID=UPI00281533EB|nr:class I SAM-dependent methyltransferase [Pelagibacterium sp. H642]WMT92600.1 class I SAM-dependent methyltransferase [Pelagibacterium sp. H642]